MEIIDDDEATIPRPHAKVSEFIQHDRTWNFTALAATLGNHPILKAIRGIVIPAHTKPDTFCWGLNNSGTFRTKSTMWIAHDKSIHEHPDWDFKWIWKINTMPKIKIFLWQICHDTVLVRGTLLKRGLPIDAGCPICLGDIESSDHLFSECLIGKRVWELADKH